MMNAGFRRENVNAVYLALHAKTLTDLLKCVQEIPIHGLSVTMPYKAQIVEHLDNSDSLTQKTGACNTVVRAQDSKLYGFNTDVAGILQPLEQRLNLNGAPVLVLGAGGAARAAVFGLKGRGAEVYILNRTAAPAQKLARQAKAKVIKHGDLKKLSFDVIINATPVGMGDGKASPLNEKEIKAKFVMDLVYGEVETRFLRLARAQGASVIPGWEMFVYQGARQFEIWTGKPAPLSEMQNEVQSAMAARARNGNNHRKK
jgi:3-dehydroquinate dehydratase/shikimate dehydrogenase